MKAPDFNPRATWSKYHQLYHSWMVKVSHPDLASSNYHADSLLLTLQSNPIERGLTRTSTSGKLSPNS